MENESLQPTISIDLKEVNNNANGYLHSISCNLIYFSFILFYLSFIYHAFDLFCILCYDVSSLDLLRTNAMLK